jgi:shikimate kinase
MKSGVNLYLVGPMGVGKTTIGKLIANKLNKQFVDLDEEIEERCGANIPWIFDVEGEQGFRKRETELLAELVKKPDLVISTGGGVVLNAENRSLLKNHGFVVFLNATVDQLYKRTLKDKKRPLLQVPDRRKVIENLKAARDPLYRETADLVFDVGQRSSKHATDELLKKLDQLAS